MNALIAMLYWINHALSTTGCLLTASFFLLILFILKLLPAQTQKKSHVLMAVPNVASQGNVRQTITDEDFVTELNLARALIEMGKKTEAVEKLMKISQEGAASQRAEAVRLLQGL